MRRRGRGLEESAAANSTDLDASRSSTKLRKCATGTADFSASRMPILGAHSEESHA